MMDTVNIEEAVDDYKGVVKSKAVVAVSKTSLLSNLAVVSPTMVRPSSKSVGSP